MSAALIAAAALLLDWLTGEPRRLHPLAGFGAIAQRMENVLNGPDRLAPRARQLRGLAAWAVLVLPPVIVVAVLVARPLAAIPIEIAVLWFALGHRSLHQHAAPVVDALDAGDMPRARQLAGRMVSRDVDTLDPAVATVESVLENGNDAVFGALFWFAVAGAPGALAYRLANTLDAMWGYRSARLLHFGRAAARIDDLLNWVPARLTAFTYALLGNVRQALACWRRQAQAWDSPNAGPVMAAGAGALSLELGGAARYRGEWHARPPLGCGAAPTGADIRRALALVRNGVFAWVLIAVLADALLAA